MFVSFGIFGLAAIAALMGSSHIRKHKSGKLKQILVSIVALIDLLAAKKSKLQ
jgi:hypothetical protein